MNVLLVYPRASLSSPQMSPPLSILHPGESLKTAKARGKSDETYHVRYYDERYDIYDRDLEWADVVGVSSMTGHQLEGAICWLKEAHALGKRTILGGVHATMLPEECLAEDFVDAVVLSEGENAIIEAIHGGKKEMYQSHLKEGEDISPVSLDTLVHFQRSAKTGDTILLTSRGCLYRCAFCYNVKFFDRRWHSVGLEQWKKDVIYLRDNAGVTKLEHGDDFLGNWPRIREILTFLQKAGIRYRPSLRADQITDDTARELAELGVRQVSVGMETKSERLLKLIRKDITNEDQLRAATALAKYDIWPMYYFITGFATETLEETYQTLDLMDTLQEIHQGGHVTQNIYSYLALPGSELWEMVDKSKLPKTMAGWSHYTFDHTDNKLASVLYQVGGLAHHQSPGDKTDKNFPGWKRALIWPFEKSAEWRWKNRRFEFYGPEKWAIGGLMKWASRRHHA